MAAEINVTGLSSTAILSCVFALCSITTGTLYQKHFCPPPTTTVMAWLLFGEACNLLGLAGMVVAVAGVAFVVNKKGIP